MSRSARCITTLAVLTTAGMLAAASASASSPPRTPLRFDPLTGSIGGVHLREPMSKVIHLLGPPDRIVRLSGVPLSFWLRGKSLCTGWALAYPENAHSKGVVTFVYLGPVRTSRGDRSGTPVSVVRKHWRGSWQYLPHLTGSDGSNYGHIGRFGSATFGFDAHKRLDGVSIQTSEQIWQVVGTPCP